MVNLGDDARRYRIVGLKARPSYSGRHNMEETAHFLSKSTASPDPQPSREEARRGRPLRGSSTSPDPREEVPPRPTLTKEFRLAQPSKGATAFPGGAHSARSDMTPRNGQRPRSKGGRRMWPQEAMDVAVPRPCTGYSGRRDSPCRSGGDVACPLRLTPLTVDMETCAASRRDRSPCPTVEDVAARRESRAPMPLRLIQYQYRRQSASTV